VVVMNHGVIEQVGAPQELYHNPRTRFVAGFIGSPAMNFISGRIRNAAFEADGGISLLINGANKELSPRNVVLGVRPEHLVLSDDGIRCQVTVVEPTGSEIQVNARAASGDEIVAVFRERHIFSPGENISLRPQAGAMHLLAAETGHRIS
jgi:multiple sugar transport system ATP-binding protein